MTHEPSFIAPRERLILSGFIRGAAIGVSF